MNPDTDLKTGLNVFRGEMLMVAPRPPIPYESETGRRGSTEDHSQNHPRVFIRERLMAFAFLAHDNYDSPRQLNNTRVTNKFIDKERGSELFDTNPS
jgi:hypothetical protein